MTDDLRRLAADFGAAPRKAQREAAAVVLHGAVNIKKNWARNAEQSAGSHAPAYPSSITYDMGGIFGALMGGIEAEIGPDKNRSQGALGNLIEYGSVNNPPHNDGGRALRDEAPKFETALAAAALDALGWR